MTKLSASGIVDNAGMVNRPEYYSGRGAISCDLNDKYLENIYESIKREYGEEAAKNYVQMVADIPKLSATDFLLTLYSLEARDWKWDKRLLGNQKGIYVDGPTDEAKIAVGFATIADVFGGMSGRDETIFIRSEFLARHGIKKHGIEKKLRNTYFFK